MHDFVSAPLTEFVWKTVETYRELKHCAHQLTFS